ncbi:helix-turn-helix transcriptional regulator [Schnuerera ultunensis]
MRKLRGFNFLYYLLNIGSLENGRYNPSILLAFKIARFFEMST